MSTFIKTAFTILLLAGCSDRQQSQADRALELFRQNKLEMALPLLQKEAARQKDNADIHVWLAETYRRLGSKDEAIREAAYALKLDSCHSFAHTVRAEACRRRHWVIRSESDTTWIHLNQAIKCDSLDGNAWLSIWNETILRQKFEMMHQSVRKMKETGFLTGAALSFGRWMLRTLPENAILMTNGDMDTYPLLAVQETEAFRPDVTVIERGLLGTRQFQHYIKDYCGISLPLEKSQLDSLSALPGMRENLSSISSVILKGWISHKRQGSFAPPIAVAVTVEENFFDDIKNHLRYAGPFFIWQSKAVDEAPDIPQLEKSLAGLMPDDFTGPWVSEQDRSPVRRVYTKYLVKNITAMAITFCEELIGSDRSPEARATLDWIEEFEKSTELGPAFTEQISQLRKLADQQKH